MLGVSHLASRKPGRLSGGEAQRVSIARALACDPAILFLDEPIAALDPPTRRSLVNDLLQILDSRGIAAVWVTHDRDEALAVGDNVTFIERGGRPVRARAGGVLAAGDGVARGLSRPRQLSRGDRRRRAGGAYAFLPFSHGLELVCGEAPLGTRSRASPLRTWCCSRRPRPQHEPAQHPAGHGEGGAALGTVAPRVSGVGRSRGRGAGDEGVVRGSGSCPGRTRGRRLQGGCPASDPPARAASPLAGGQGDIGGRGSVAGVSRPFLPPRFPAPPLRQTRGRRDARRAATPGGACRRAARLRSPLFSE